MVLPASGTISWNDIQNEFGGSNPISINEYYKGGSLVPNHPGHNSIPTSGTISANNFYNGIAFYGFAQSNYNLNGYSYFPDSSTCRVNVFSSSGYSLQRTEEIGLVTLHSGNWFRSASNTGSNFEVRATLNSGSLTNGDATGVWLSCGLNRFWEVSTDGNVGSRSANITLEFRLTSIPSIILGSYTVSMIAITQFNV